MHSRLFAAAAIAGVLLLVPDSADASCCEQGSHHMKAEAGCCDRHGVKPKPGEDNILLPFFETDPPLASVDDDPQFAPAPPVRQLTEVWFHRPVMVGRHILQGRYVIEHDNDRMARGKPCTHIYAYNNQKVPVVQFHCTHLERDRAHANTVVLATAGDGSMKRLLEFQFAGEIASHGVPAER